MVFGPALDGGYYLVGVSCLPHGLFEVRVATLLGCESCLPVLLWIGPDDTQGITWSTETVLDANTARAEALGLRVAPISTLPHLRDIDTIEVCPGY